MFALEIGFQDGVSQPEMILVRRPMALIGASDYAQVMIDDMRDLGYQLRIVRDVGSRFECVPIASEEDTQLPDSLEGVFDGPTAFNLGKVRLVVTPLDIDLMMRDGEPPDRAGVRILRQGSLEKSPNFPALVVAGTPPMAISFAVDQPLYIGRSKLCAVRLDSADVSSRHARMGYEGGEFWIEDLGSTNGTFVNGQQVAGRIDVAPGTPITLGREITIFGVTSEDQINSATSFRPVADLSPATSEQRFPILISVSEVARPARLVLNPGSAVTIGRDPNSDMWLGAPHVSRKHCSVVMTHSLGLAVTDFSTNGTAYDGGILQKGDVLEIENSPHVLDFGGGVTVALCFDSEQEQTFANTQGGLYSFVPNGTQSGFGRMSSNPSVGAGESERYPTSPRVHEDYTAQLTVWQRIAFAYEASSPLARIILFVAVMCFLGLMFLVLKLLWGILQ